MNLTTRWIGCATLGLGLVFAFPAISGCEQEKEPADHLEDAGESLDDAAESAGEAGREAVDDAGEAIDEAAEQVEDQFD